MRDIVAHPQPAFQQAIIDAVRPVTHIAPADARGEIIGSPVVAPGVIRYALRELGLCAGFTLGTVLGMVRLVAQMAYGAARETFRSTYEWTPSPRAVMRMVDATGDEARPFLEQAAVPDDDGEVLVIQVDGRGAPMITEEEMRRRRRAHRHPHRSPGGRHARRARRRENPRRRRTSGKKSKNAKVAVV